MLQIYPVFATDVTISVRASQQVGVLSIERFDSFEKGQASVTRGGIRAGAKDIAIFKLRFPAGDVGSRKPVEVSVGWQPEGKRRKHRTSHSVTFEYAPGRINSPQPVDHRVALLVTQAWRNAILWQAYQLISEGHEEEANRIIKVETLHFERYCRGRYPLTNQLFLLAEGLRTLGAA